MTNEKTIRSSVRSKSDMTEGPFLAKIVRYSIPVIFTSILQLLFNTADLVVVGQAAGSECVGAIGATSPIIHLVVNTFTGLSVGAGVAAAHAIGAGNEESVHRAVHTSIPIAVLLGAVLTFVGAFWSETFLGWMNTPAELLPLSAMYFRIYCFATVPILVYSFGAAILRAAGDTKTPFFILFSAGVLNIGMNFLFVLAFGMDVDGVAFATLLSQAFSAAAVVFALCRRQDACRLELKKMRFYKEELKKILRIGVPSSVQSSLFYISQVVIQSSVNSFGSVTVQGAAAAGSILSYVNVTVNGFCHAALNFTGQNYGAGKFGNIKKVIRVSFLCSGLSGIVLGAASWLAGRPLLTLYLGSKVSEGAIAEGLTRLLCVGTPYLFYAVMDVLINVQRGMGHSLSPMYISVIGTCGARLLFALVLFRYEPFHNTVALFLSFPVSWFLTAAGEAVCFRIVWKKEKKKAQLQPSAV